MGGLEKSRGRGRKVLTMRRLQAGRLGHFPGTNGNLDDRRGKTLEPGSLYGHPASTQASQSMVCVGT
jgi:hypothetical protein